MAVWLVTGARGMLGAKLVTTLRAAGHTAHALPAGVDIVSNHWWPPDLDRVDVVVNCAAATDVDRCERDPVYAYRANALGAGHVALICAQRETPLVHVSTDHVFPGAGTGPYSERDPALPVNRYGASKLVGENMVLGAHDASVVVRTAWLHDGPRPMPGGRHTFASWIASLNVPEVVLPHQVGHPTWVGAVADRILLLGLRVTQGLPDGVERVYHAVGPGAVTKVRYAEMVAEYAGNPAVFVAAPDDVEGGRAKRPGVVTMSQLAWDTIGLRPMPSVADQMRAAFARTNETPNARVGPLGVT